MKRFFFCIKRTFDILVSGMGLILLFPIFLIIGFFIKIDSAGPIFFVQNRAGKDGKVFQVYKLRTMDFNSDKKGRILRKDDPQITRVGKILREWGFDELPQLINVFKGEMSLVGPRPTLIEQVEQYSKKHKRRLEMKPGLTGWALVNGRNTLTWVERIEYDIWYIDHWSLWLDFKILLRTILVVFKREGVYGKDGINLGYFEDNADK